MDWIARNWKTGIVGLGLLVVAVGHSFQTGTINMNDFMAVLAALGLVAAKDGNVSGS